MALAEQLLFLLQGLTRGAGCTAQAAGWTMEGVLQPKQSKGITIELLGKGVN